MMGSLFGAMMFLGSALLVRNAREERLQRGRELIQKLDPALRKRVIRQIKRGYPT
jgi:hypothetical protein